MDKKLIISPENLKGVLVDMTSEEISQREKDALQNTIIKDAITKKANDKISAQNKLKALGLTDAEIEAL